MVRDGFDSKPAVMTSDFPWFGCFLDMNLLIEIVDGDKAYGESALK